MDRDIVVHYSSTMDVEQWMRSHEQGLVPGHVPYGLNRLEESGCSVSYSQGRGAGRSPVPYAGLLGPRRMRRPGVQSSNLAAVAWDERTAVTLLARYGPSPRRLGAGVIWATDDLVERPRSTRLKIVGEVLRRMDVVWCLSRAQLPVLSSWLHIDADRIRFLPFGIDVDLFGRQRWSGEPLIVSVGNDRHRDIPTLYAALARVRRARPNIRMVVQTRSDLPAPQGVETFRSLSFSALRALYARACAVVVASSHNLHVSGMTVCLEAMATGRPAVLSRTPGAEDYVLEGVTGLLAQPGDPRSHAAALLRLIDEPGLAESLGAAAAARVRSHHSESTMCNAMAEMLFSPAQG